MVGVTTESGAVDLKRSNWDTSGGLRSFTLGGLSGGLQGFPGAFNEKEDDIFENGSPSLWTGVSKAPPQVCSKHIHDLDGLGIGPGQPRNEDIWNMGGSSGGGPRSSKFSVKFDGQARSKRKKDKTIKESSECSNLVFGVYLHFDSMMVASELILVGRARGKFFSANYIMEWIQNNWTTSPNMDFEVITLTKRVVDGDF